MTPREVGPGPAEAASGWAARLTSPRVQILAVTALMLTNMPLAWYGKPLSGSSGPPDYLWSSLGVLLALWQLWNRRPLAWVVLTVATAATPLMCGLSVAGVINTGLSGWWMLVIGAADSLALAMLLSPPIRRWVAKPPAPVP